MAIWNGTTGRGRSSGRSSAVNTLNRDPARFWNGWALNAATRSWTAARSSASDANWRSRREAITAVAMLPTVPSTDALSFGLPTRPGSTAAE